MNTDALIARVRMDAFIPNEAQAPDYTDDWILQELIDRQTIQFDRTVINSGESYRLQQYSFLITPGVALYAIPPRASAGGLEKIDIAYDANLNWVPLTEVGEDDARLFEQGQPGQVAAFIVRGDSFQLLPTPDASAFSIRVSYYLRPSQLVSQQENSLNGGTRRGYITSFDPVDRFGVVDVIPYDMLAISGGSIVPAPILDGQPCDIVRSTGWHEVLVASVIVTYTGTNVAFGQSYDTRTTDSLARVRLGDYLRAADQSEWPQLPDDYHRCLTDAVAIKILTQLNLTDKAGVLVEELSADLSRFQDLITPRVKQSGGKDIVAPFSMYRGYGRARVAKYP
jgi:hypothetical protein